jgi:hypothetical protein
MAASISAVPKGARHYAAAVFSAAAIVIASVNFHHILAESAPQSGAGAYAGIDQGRPSPVSGREDWPMIKSAYFDIFIDRAAEADTVARKLSRRGLISGGSFTSTQEERLASGLDIIMRRVKQVLDMRPAMPRVKIVIFGGRADLEGEYSSIFGTSGSGIRSFYVHKYGTIYTSEETVSDSVMAHEMAHAVVDNYFSVVPPKKLAEIMASYVDVHLDDSY